MPKISTMPRKRITAKAPVAEKMDLFKFRDTLRDKILEDHKSLRNFALDNEEALGYHHSNTLGTLSSGKNRPSVRVLKRVADVLGVKIDYHREIVEFFVIK